MIQDRLLQITPRRQLNAQRFSECGQQLFNRVELSEWDKDYTVLELSLQYTSQFDGQTSFPDPSRSQNGDQSDAGTLNKVNHLVHFTLTSDNGCDANRKPLPEM
jgi:hypothetical protein